MAIIIEMFEKTQGAETLRVMVVCTEETIKEMLQMMESDGFVQTTESYLIELTKDESEEPTEA